MILTEEHLENFIIGSMINEHSCLSIGLELIYDANVFRSKGNQIIFSAMLDMNMRSKPVDVFSVRKELQLQSKWEGLQSHWEDVIDHNSEIQVFEHHVTMLLDEYRLRVIQSVTDSLTAKVKERSASPSDLINQAINQFEQLMASDRGIHIISAGKVMNEVKDDIIRMRSGQRKEEGIECGYEEFGKDFRFSEGDFTVLAARPSMGKSAFMIQLAKNLAVDQNIPVGVISLEMTQKENIYRLMSNVLKINSRDIQNGFEYNRKDSDRFFGSVVQYQTMPLYLNEDYMIDNVSLKAKVVYFSRVLKCKVVFIDHLGLIDMTKIVKELRITYDQAIGQVTRMLKTLAAKEKITIVALSQLSRKVEERKPSRPVLSDLRDSGNIEADASRVIFLYRPEYYAKIDGESAVDDIGRDLTGITEVFLAKNRNGNTGFYYFDTKLSSSLYEEDHELNKEKPKISASSPKNKR